MKWERAGVERKIARAPFIATLFCKGKHATRVRKGWVVALIGFPTQRIAWRLKQLAGRQATLFLDAKHQNQGEGQRTHKALVVV